MKMREFNNKLSIWNEGGLPFGLSLEDLKVEHNSRPRNPKIAKACFMAGYIDTWGRGTLKIINACKEAGFPEPEIKEMNGGVQVTIYKEGDGGLIGGSIGGLIGGSIELTERQEQVLALIRQDNKISIKQLAKKLNINSSAIDKHIEVLKNKEVIERIGGTRGYWHVKLKGD